MPVSAKLFKINRYPSEFPIETVPTNTGLGDDFQLRTKMELLGKGEYTEKDLTKLNIIHDKGTEFEGIGYSKEDGRITDLISIAEEKQFPAFVLPEKDYLITAFSAKVMFNQAIRRLSQYYDTFDTEGKKRLDAKPVKVDLQKVKESFSENGDAPKIRGGWFKDLKITNVDVAYIGGGEVDDSDEWFKYETSGKISALRLDYPNPDPDEEPFRLLITSDGAIFSYKNFAENQFLKIIVPIYEYLKQYVVE